MTETTAKRPHKRKGIADLKHQIEQLEVKRKKINGEIQVLRERIEKMERAKVDKVLSNLNPEQMKFLVELAEKADDEKIKTVKELLDD